MIYRYNESIVKEHKTKFALIGIAVAFALTLSVGAFSTVNAATPECTFTTSGSVMTLDGDCEIDERMVVLGGVTLDGGGHTIYPTFEKTSNSNNSSLAILSDDVTIKDLTIDGVGGTNLHGINIYVSENILINNVTVINNDNTGIVVNGSEVTVNNISTANNGWNGINVDQGGGVTSPAILTITGHSSHTDFAHIKVEDTLNANLVVNDTLPQYVYAELQGAGYYQLDVDAPEKVDGMTIYKGNNTSGANLGCSGYTNERWITVDWNDSNDVNFAYYRYQVKNGWSTTLTTSQRTGQISDEDGEYKYRVQAVDTAGNVGEYSDWCFVTLDRVAPVSTVTSHSNGDIVRGGVTVRGGVVDDNPHHYYTIVKDDSGNRVAGPGTVNRSDSFTNEELFVWDTTGVADGQYTILLASRDAAGNRDDSAGSLAVVTVTVDNSAPELTLASPVDGDVERGIIGLKAICDEECDYVNFWWREESQSYSNVSPDRRYHYERDNGTEFTWQLNTIEAERWGGDSSYVMTDGTYYFYAATKDLAGNWARSAEIKVVVDNNPNDMNACKKDGWKVFLNPTFKNQGDCVSFVVSDNQAERNPDAARGNNRNR